MSSDEAFAGCRCIEYRALMNRLADLVGRHQLPINPKARDINEILDGDPVHSELIRDVVRSIYRAGRCSHLDVEVGAETVFDALGQLRGELLADGRTDVDQVNLLEALGQASSTLFATPPSPATGPLRALALTDHPPIILSYPAV